MEIPTPEVLEQEIEELEARQKIYTQKYLIGSVLSQLKKEKQVPALIMPDPKNPSTEPLRFRKEWMTEIAVQFHCHHYDVWTTGGAYYWVSIPNYKDDVLRYFKVSKAEIKKYKREGTWEEVIWQ